MRILRILWFYFLFLGILTQEGHAGKVILTCAHAGSYAGTTLSFLTWRDMITYKEDTLLVVRVKKDGTFEGSFSIDGPLKIFTRPGIYEAWLYVEPGKTYNIVLPPRKDKSMKDILNPYFHPVRLRIGLTGEGKNDLNRLIGKLEKIYAPYFYHHAREVYVDKKDTTLERFIQSVRDTFSGIQNPFFRNYMNARLAMLTVMNMRERAPVLDEYRDFGKRVLFRNPAYMELFNQVFNRYFTYLLRHNYRQLLVSAIHTSQYDSLIEAIKTDLAVYDEDFTDLVALKGIYDAWYHNTFSRDKLLTMLDKMRLSARNPKIKQVGLDMKEKFTFLASGTFPPDFSLTDLKGHEIQLTALKGKYIYLNFSSRLSYSSLREFPLLVQLQKRYGNFLQIVTVALEGQPEILKEFIQEKGYNWPFLICGDTCSLPVKYKIKVYPTYFLLDPDGELVWSPAPLPTEDFERKFRQLLNKKGIRTGVSSMPGTRQ